jgi:hypothetical protein
MITNKKEYNITNYEAVFNDTNLMCGVTINLDQYTLPLQELEDSLFKIDFDNNKIVVENNKYIINTREMHDKARVNARKINDTSTINIRTHDK